MVNQEKNKAAKRVMNEPLRQFSPLKEPPASKGVSVEKVLIENFVSLQKVMTNLAVKFDSLSSQISKLLELFEISAKTLAEKDYSQDKNVSEKLDNLLEQNKVIAKGIALLHETREPEPAQPPMRTIPRVQMPLQRAPISQQQMPARKFNEG